MATVTGLHQELIQLEGILGQNPETGAQTGGSFLGQYTNRLFGAPFQLMDSVDRRFSDINTNLGNEYLRNFMLNSPILHVKPGMPKYTGHLKGNDAITSLKQIYADATVGGANAVHSLLDTLAQNIIFGGDGPRRRMFGFRETYYDYMQHVNYMCHVVAELLGLTQTTEFPTKVLTSNGFEPLADVQWQNYRMMGTSPRDPKDQLMDMVTKNSIGTTIDNIFDTLTTGAQGIIESLGSFIGGDPPSALSILQSTGAEIVKNWEESSSTPISVTMSNKISTVQFMVEPVQFEENFTNETSASMIASAIDGLNTVGAEIQWMSNSSVDAGLIDEALKFMDNAAESVINLTEQLTSGITGGFIGNLFSGAFNSLKGQKMLYPEIYKSSSTSMNYQYTVNLISPYGDVYNYFINIVVPLLHLIALAAPRMVTANSISSPYLVQSYIPGMCSCQLGIVQDMTITKNPDGKHVSVNGFPLTVKVTFTIKELYRNLSISAANDPELFLFNETLNDYMCNLAGLIPSLDSYTKVRQASFGEMEDYLNPSTGLFANDVANSLLEQFEDTFNPYAGR